MRSKICIGHDHQSKPPALPVLAVLHARLDVRRKIGVNVDVQFLAARGFFQRPSDSIVDRSRGIVDERAAGDDFRRGTGYGCSPSAKTFGGLIDRPVDAFNLFDERPGQLPQVLVASRLLLCLSNIEALGTGPRDFFSDIVGFAPESGILTFKRCKPHMQVAATLTFRVLGF